MVCLAVRAGGHQGFLEWRRLFADLDPGLRVVDWADPALDPATVDFALVWDPEPGRLARMSNLRAILSAAAGVDHITRDPHWPRDVPLIRMGGEETAVQMGDYVLWAVFSLLRDARTLAIGQQNATWRRAACAVRMSSDVTVGVMGLGNLGAHVARRLAGAGLRVAGWARSPRQMPGIACHAGPEELPAFLRSCDILVCLLPDTPQTRNCVNADMLSHLRRPAGLVNVGRGTLIVDGDVLRALDDGTLFGAVLDVFRDEPLPPASPFWSHPRVTVTPHVAAEASRSARARYVAAIIQAILKGEEVPLRYQPDRSY
ncbi:2-hydroxyacid dehydrogenase [Gluconacetobacter tumulisoli]|uniref:Glyoxylate/hydroxypyruvate reductase A n=1 Tax=Gluconacetobacter tumulisoli TaxID=1286189 RepID=A0A7W4K5K7_9PROT|nr:glyoxylate/hydroxypyruvate reductase A [Gluconacetobacter tumulisoli]MBB2200657.1 glyoxylate/hydroxypyruvate reductase A [Gluconacetobacter tumulisoli]